MREKLAGIRSRELKLSATAEDDWVVYEVSADLLVLAAGRMDAQLFPGAVAEILREAARRWLTAKEGGPA